MVYTDNCHSDREALQETLGPASVARPDRVPSSPSAAEQLPVLPLLDFLPDMVPKPIIVTSVHCPNSTLACSQLAYFARDSVSRIPGDVVVLGFDCEWAASLTGRRKVAGIQMSSLDGYTAIFHVKSRGSRGSEAGIMPNALKELLENEEIQLVRVVPN